MWETEKAAAPPTLRPSDEAARGRRAEREARILGLLNRGVAVADIAALEGVSLKRMRNCIRELLAKREPRPPAAFLAEASRLEQALLVPFSAMANEATGANFRAIDEVIAIVRALDRCHGFSPAGWRRASGRLRRRSSSHTAPGGPGNPQQPLEDARFGLGLADGPPHAARVLATTEPASAPGFNSSHQTFEKARFGLGATGGPPRPPSLGERP